jgi:hypothetical protein
MEASAQRNAPAVLPPEKERRYPLFRWLIGPQSRSGKWSEQKSIYSCRELNTSLPSSP